VLPRPKAEDGEDQRHLLADASHPTPPETPEFQQKYILTPTRTRFELATFATGKQRAAIAPPSLPGSRFSYQKVYLSITRGFVSSSSHRQAPRLNFAGTTSGFVSLRALLFLSNCLPCCKFFNPIMEISTVADSLRNSTFIPCGLAKALYPTVVE